MKHSSLKPSSGCLLRHYSLPKSCFVESVDCERNWYLESLLLTGSSFYQYFNVLFFYGGTTLIFAWTSSCNHRRCSCMDKTEYEHSYVPSGTASVQMIDRIICKQTFFVCNELLKSVSSNRILKRILSYNRLSYKLILINLDLVGSQASINTSTDTLFPSRHSDLSYSELH